MLAPFGIGPMEWLIIVLIVVLVAHRFWGGWPNGTA